KLTFKIFLLTHLLYPGHRPFHPFLLSVFFCLLTLLCPLITHGQQKDDRKLNTVKSKKANKNNSKIKDYKGDSKAGGGRSKNNNKIKNYTGDVKSGSAGSGSRAPRHNSYVSVPKSKTQKSAAKLKKYSGDDQE